MKRFGLARSIVTAAFVAAAFAPAAQAAGSYSNIFIFGDSISDAGFFGGLPATQIGEPAGVGNLPEGNRWTVDGPKSDLYVDYLAKQFGLTVKARKPTAAGGNDYAPGGGRARGDIGTTTALANQVATFLGDVGGKADPNALYVVTVGGNDIADALKSAIQTGSSAGAQAIAVDAATQIVKQVATLQAKGANRIVVANSPDIGKVPQIFNTVVGLAPSTLAAGLSSDASIKTALQKLAAAGIGLPDLSGNAALVGALKTNVAGATANAIGAADIGAAVNAAHLKLNANTAAYSATNSGLLDAAQAAITSYSGKLAPAAASAFAQTLAGALAAQGVTLSPQQVAGITAALTQSYKDGLIAGAGSLVTTYNTVSGQATSLIDSLYHPLLNNGLGALGGNIVYADVNRLMKEAMANPAAFGFGSALGYACPTGTPANLCTSNAATGFDNSKSFFYADDFHPTPLTHRLFGQYVTSILNAPYYAAQLVNNQPIALNAAQSALDERAGQARSVGALEGFARISRLNNDQNANSGALKSDGSNTAVTVGADYQAASHVSAGVAFTQSKNKTDFADNAGSFKATNRLMSVFARYEAGPINVSGDVFFGSTRFSDVDRKIQLAALSRTERGDTQGSQAGFRVAGSYLVSLGKVNLAPTVSLAYREGKVGGYSENCTDLTNVNSCSTSMRYEKQRIDSLLLGAGVKLDADLGMIQPFGSVMFFNDSKDKDRQVHAALVNAAPIFTTDVYTPDSSYAVLNIGARAKLSNSVNAYASYSRTSGAGDEKRDAFSLGVQAAF